jgi:predicted acetyltransferase
VQIDIRPIRDDEVPAYRAAVLGVFGGDPGADAVGNERLRATIAPGRAWAAFDRGLIVGTAGTFDFGVTVPGSERPLPFAGLTMVTVRPTHRRRGILRALVAAHLEEARSRGLAASALWASEASIYQRFGYGLATELDEVSFVGPEARFAQGPLDDVEPLDETAPEVVPPVYDAVRAGRPGMLTRPEPWWKYRRFMDRPDQQQGASARRHAVARRGGAATGTIAYRLRGGWDQGVAAGTMVIDELIATDARAEATLWRFAAAIDLFPKVTYWNAPVDALLPWIVEDGRRIRRRRTDGMWLRVDDVPAALAARRYLGDGTLRLEVIDPPAASGAVFELAVAGGAGSCAPSRGDADLRLDRAALGSIFLGGLRPSLLARAGRVQGAPAAVALADRLFDVERPPWCAEVF